VRRARVGGARGARPPAPVTLGGRVLSARRRAEPLGCGAGYATGCGAGRTRQTCPRRGTSPAHGPNRGCCAPWPRAPTRRGARAGGRGLSGAGCAGMWATWCGTRARDRRPLASTRETMCGPRERPVTAAEPLAARGRPAAPRSTPRRGGGRRCRKFGREGVKMSQHLVAGSCAPSFHVGSLGAGATPADRADAMHPSGVLVTLLPGPLWVVGWSAPAHREEHAGDAGLTRATPLPGAGSSWARVAATGRAAAPRLSGVHVALAVGHGRVGLWRAATRRTRKERAGVQ